MKRDYYSHSSIQTYLTCPLQFKYRYFDKIPSKTSVEAFVGSIVHKCLEIFYRVHQEKKIYLSLRKLLEYYKKIWKRKWNKDDIFIIRDDTSVTDYFFIGANCIAYYYRVHFQKNHKIEKTISVEEEVNVKLGSTKFRGFIDRLVQKHNGVIEIHDYKTGRYIPSKKERELDTQLALYQLAISNKYPNKTIKLIWYYLQKKKKIEIEKTPEELNLLRKKILKIVKKIESQTEFKPKKSYLCPWCSYKKICPLFQFKPGYRKTSL